MSERRRWSGRRWLASGGLILAASLLSGCDCAGDAAAPCASLVEVRAPWPGASPERVERELAEPLEARLLRDGWSVASTSYEGLLVIEVGGASLAEVASAIRGATLPEGAEAPSVGSAAEQRLSFAARPASFAEEAATNHGDPRGAALLGDPRDRTLRVLPPSAQVLRARGLDQATLREAIEASGARSPEALSAVDVAGQRLDGLAEIRRDPFPAALRGGDPVVLLRWPSRPGGGSSEGRPEGAIDVTLRRCEGRPRIEGRLLVVQLDFPPGGSAAFRRRVTSALAATIPGAIELYEVDALTGLRAPSSTQIVALGATAAELPAAVREAVGTYPGVIATVQAPGDRIAYFTLTGAALDEGEAQLRALLGARAEVTEVVPAPRSAPTLDVVPDAVRATQLGVSPDAIAQQVRDALDGAPAGEHVRLGLGEDDPSALASLLVPTQAGDAVRLGEIAALRRRPGAAARVRVGGLPARRVEVRVRPGADLAELDRVVRAQLSVEGATLAPRP